MGGVIVFILLAGRMPFGGATPKEIKEDIAEGRYTMEPETWCRLTTEAKDFTSSLLQVDPAGRLSAAQAIEHKWMQQRHMWSRSRSTLEVEVDASVVEGLRRFGKASKF